MPRHSLPRSPLTRSVVYCCDAARGVAAALPLLRSSDPDGALTAAIRHHVNSRGWNLGAMPSNDPSRAVVQNPSLLQKSRVQTSRHILFSLFIPVDFLVVLCRAGPLVVVTTAIKEKPTTAKSEEEDGQAGKGGEGGHAKRQEREGVGDTEPRRGQREYLTPLVCNAVFFHPMQ